MEHQLSDMEMAQARREFQTIWDRHIEEAECDIAFLRRHVVQLDHAIRAGLSPKATIACLANHIYKVQNELCRLSINTPYPSVVRPQDTP